MKIIKYQFSILVLFTLLSCSMRQDPLSIVVNGEIKENSILVSIENITERTVHVMPPYFAPASNLYIYIKDEGLGEIVLNKRGSSSAPDYIEILAKNKYIIEIKVPNLGFKKISKILYKPFWTRENNVSIQVNLEKIHISHLPRH